MSNDDLWMQKHNRNVVGRTLMNIERTKVITPTIPEEVEAMFPNNYEAQEDYIKRLIVELGGPVLRPGKFELDDSPQWEGFTYGETWNGWAMPLFANEVADQIMEHINSQCNPETEGIKFDATINGYWYMPDKINYEDEAEPFLIEETGLVAFGSGYWTWTEVEEVV